MSDIRVHDDGVRIESEVVLRLTVHRSIDDRLLRLDQILSDLGSGDVPCGSCRHRWASGEKSISQSLVPGSKHGVLAPGHLDRDAIHLVPTAHLLRDQDREAPIDGRDGLDSSSLIRQDRVLAELLTDTHVLRSEQRLALPVGDHTGIVGTTVPQNGIRKELVLQQGDDPNRDGLGSLDEIVDGNARSVSTRNDWLKCHDVCPFLRARA